MRLALKLLYQFRVVINGSSGVFRRCEERYIVLDAPDGPLEAFEKFYKERKRRNHSYTSTDGHRVHCEFVGIIDYILLGTECCENEFWYDFFIKKLPMERKNVLTLSKSEIKTRIKRQLGDVGEDCFQYSSPRLEPRLDVDILVKQVERYKKRKERLRNVSDIADNVTECCEETLK